MRIGLMLGPERGRYRQKVGQLIADAAAAERAGFASIWVPQIPGDFDAFTAITLMGQATARIELGTAVMPIQTRHPIAMAQEVLSVQAVCEGRFTLGIGTSHDWVIEGMLGLSYARPAVRMRNYLEVLNAALAGPGSVDVENEDFRVHSPMDVTDMAPNPVLLAALAPVIAAGHSLTTATRLASDYGTDEIASVARAFDGPVQELWVRLQELTRDRARMEAILSGMAEGVVVLDRQGRVQLINRGGAGDAPCRCVGGRSPLSRSDSTSGHLRAIDDRPSRR